MDTEMKLVIAEGDDKEKFVSITNLVLQLLENTTNGPSEAGTVLVAALVKLTVDYVRDGKFEQASEELLAVLKKSLELNYKNREIEKASWMKEGNA